MPPTNRDQYWASLPKEQLAPEIIKRTEEYYAFLETSGMLRKYLKSHNVYFGHSMSGMFQSSSEIAYGGEEGELNLVKVNNYRLNIQHVLVLTTQSRPALEARASNTDAKSKEQTILANGILDYYLRDKRLERFLKTAVEHSLIWGEGFIEQEWDTALGEPYGVDPASGKRLNEGDISYRNPMGPLEVVRDIYAKEYDPKGWKIVIRSVNKFDLIAKFPEYQDEILKQSSSLLDAKYNSINGNAPYDNGDLVRLKVFYHPPTPALPDGRMSWCLDAKTVLLDGPMPYQNLPNGIPLYRITPAEFYGVPFGYTHAWDTLGLAEVTDALYSTVVTNQTSFGVQNIAVPKGHDLSYQQLTGGLNLIEFDPKLGKPEPLQLTKTAPEIFNFIGECEKMQSLLLGVNDVIKGDPQASLESGSALALVASQAIQFNSGLQASYVALLEDVGTATIRMLQTFANTTRVASIAGSADRFMLKSFSSEDISKINRVIVDVSNPLSRTISGRLQMAQDLLKIPGLIKHSDEYTQVLETGSYRPLVEDQENELLTIDAEREMLQQGQKPSAILTDNHSLHIRSHKGVLAMPDSRTNPQIVQAVLSHIQDHIDQLQKGDPRVLMITDQQPLPPPPPPPGQGGPQQAPPQGPPHQGPPGPPHGMPPHPGNGGGPQNMPAVTNSTNPVTAQAEGVRQAQMPKNPMPGGIKFNPQTGGLPGQ